MKEILIENLSNRKNLRCDQIKKLDILTPKLINETQ